MLFAIADGAEPDTAGMTLLWARIKFARGDLGGALQALLAAETMNSQLPGIHIQMGERCCPFAPVAECENCLRESNCPGRGQRACLSRAVNRLSPPW